jgi:hypothetical protein
MHSRNACGRFRDKRIIRVAEPANICVFTQARQVHKRLWVFDAKTNLEGLGLNGEALLGQRANGIARAMTEREYDRITRKSSLRRPQSAHAITDFDLQCFESRIKMKSHAHRFESGSQPGQDPMQTIGPDMGPGVECNLGIGPGRNQRLQDGRFECVLGSRIEFAVGIGPCPALTEEDVPFRIEFPCSLKPSHRETAIPKSGPAIDEVHTDSVARQRPCGIEPCGPGSNDHDTARQPSPFEDVEFESGRGIDESGATALESAVEAPGPKVHIEIEIDVNHVSKFMSTAATARIEGTACDPESVYVPLGNTYGLRTPCT